jgi:hypothetical protein
MTMTTSPTTKKSVRFLIPHQQGDMDFSMDFGNSPGREGAMTPPSSPSKRTNAAAVERLVRQSSLLWISSELEATDDDEYEPSYSTLAKTCHHRQYSPNVTERRNPWNSPDTAEPDRNTPFARMQLVPPPPPPPPRRIRIASIENFHPILIFGKDFPYSSPQQQQHCPNSSKRSSHSMDLLEDCKENEIDSSYNNIVIPSSPGGPLHKKPKLAMKKEDYGQYLQDHHATSKPLSLKGILARMIA